MNKKKGIQCISLLLCLLMLAGCGQTSIQSGVSVTGIAEGSEQESLGTVMPDAAEEDNTGRNTGTENADMQTEILSGIIPDKLEYIPDSYKSAAKHQGALEKLTYDTWESFSYTDTAGYTEFYSEYNRRSHRLSGRRGCCKRQETRALAAQYNIQVECWYPIGHADPDLLQNDVLAAIAEAHGKSVVQVILRWHMQEGFCAVPGSTNPDHIQENIGIFDFELAEDEMEQIRSLDKGENGRYFNINYKQLGSYFMSLNE